MANILKFSTRRSDDLLSENVSAASTDISPSKDLPKKQLDQAPESTFEPVPHELLSETGRRVDLAALVNERRTLAGTAQAEHFINELYSASQINRGPPGFSPSSRLHFDMLTGRDDKIDFADYLNFSKHQI